MTVNLVFLDSEFGIVQKAPLIQEFVWNRKWYTFGEFSIMCMPIANLDIIKYIYHETYEQIGIVQKLEYDSVRKMVIFRGFFGEYLLTDDIIYPQYNLTTPKTPIQIVYDLVENYSSLKNLVVDKSLNPDIEKTLLQDIGTELGYKLYDILGENFSYNLNLNFDTNELVFKVVEGKDRTDKQDLYPQMTFETSRQNIKQFSYSNDDSNYKNYVVISAQDRRKGNEGQRIYYEYDGSMGEPIQKIYVEETRVFYDGSITLEEFNDVLKQKAIEKLAKFSIIENIRLTVFSDYYRKSYDLGDKVNVILTDPNKYLNIKTTATITEVKEVYSEGKQNIEVVIGNVIPTIYGKARL